MGNNISTSNENIRKFSHFSEYDIQQWNITFNTMFPNKYITFRDFTRVFVELFPGKNVEPFCKILFKTINIASNGKIDFNEVMLAFSILHEGSKFEKIRWIYRLFNLENNNEVSRTDILTVLKYYDLIFDIFKDRDIEMIKSIFTEHSYPFDRFMKIVEENEIISFFNFN